jgi:hypothetical protein
MIYGREKIKVMQRSILPSQARRMARERKRKLVRQNRRSNSAALACYQGPGEYVVGLWDDDSWDLSYWAGPNRAYYGEIIYDRRSADKLSHFEVWAYHRTKHLRPEDRWSKISGLLPKGVIGDHAMSHLDFLIARHPAEFWRYRGDDYWDLPRQLRKPPFVSRYSSLYVTEALPPVHQEPHMENGESHQS